MGKWYEQRLFPCAAPGAYPIITRYVFIDKNFGFLYDYLYALFRVQRANWPNQNKPTQAQALLAQASGARRLIPQWQVPAYLENFRAGGACPVIRIILFMKKTKDILLLLLCGLVCGGFFVGCILGMGAIINYVHSHSSLGLSKSTALILLAAVIVGALKIIEKLYKYFTRNSKNPQITRYKDVSVVDEMDEMSKNIPFRHFDK